MAGTFAGSRNRTRAISRDVIGVGLRAIVGGGTVTLPSGETIDPSQLMQRARGLTRPFTVTNASQQGLPVDFDRKFLFIQNNAVLGDVWCSYGVAAVIGVGMKFAAGGGGILLDNNVPTSEIYFIGTVANNPSLTIITA